MALNSADIRGRGVRTRRKYDKDRNRRETQRQTDRQTDRQTEREGEEEQETESVNRWSKKKQARGDSVTVFEGGKGVPESANDPLGAPPTHRGGGRARVMHHARRLLHPAHPGMLEGERTNDGSGDREEEQEDEEKK